MSAVRVAVVSDIHFAGPQERLRAGHESAVIGNPLLRLLVGSYRHHIWLRDVFAHNHLLDYFLQHAKGADWVVGNGDFSCDTAFIGPMDDACRESAALCLDRLRGEFPERFLAVMGDHELGKKSIFGGAGGMRIKSSELAEGQLGIQPFWVQDLGVYRLIGVCSSLAALPVFDADLLADELPHWEQRRHEHLEQIAGAFAQLRPDQKVVLFCHDPSALPFLLELDSVREHIGQIEQTIIGHLHSELIVRMSRYLSGMPHIAFLGSTVNRLSAALRKSKTWKLFKIQLCPSLAGIELLKDGGFLWLELDPSGEKPSQVSLHPVPRRGLEEARPKDH